MTCEFAHDDGAYVLGALSPAERSAYEKHLAGCAECREAVAEIAVLPGLLGRLPASRVESDSPSSEATASRMPALLEAAGARRVREQTVRRRWYAGAGVAAALVAVLAGVGVAASWPWNSDSGGGDGPSVSTGATPTPVTVHMVAMTPVAGKVPVSAEVGLNGTKWGTEVTMHCTYPEADYRRAYTFRLVAHGVDGTQEQVGSWMAGPGDDITVNGATRFGASDLVRLEITKYDGTPLLQYDVP